MIAPDLLSLLSTDIMSEAEALTKALVSPVAKATVPMDAMLRRRSPQRIVTNPKIMVVDDEPINIKVVRKYLKETKFEDVLSTTDPRQVMQLAEEQQPDCVLLDVMMPGMSGFEVLQQLATNPATADIPVLVLSAANNKSTRIKAIRMGAHDFLCKPVDPVELIPRVRNALVIKAHVDHLRSQTWELEHQVMARTAELARSQTELVACLARAAEYRDDDTGFHVKRVSRYVEIIAEQIGMHPRLVQLLGQAATLHDIGKIGIPDDVLNKPGRLDEDERDLMNRHCTFGTMIMEAAMCDGELAEFVGHTDSGARMLSSASSPILRVAARIALAHHERWDGQGYPLRLRGEEIPTEARMTAIADVFDALSSPRAYKKAIPLEKCRQIMLEGRGTHFDPRLLDAFMNRWNDVLNVRDTLMDLPVHVNHGRTPDAEPVTAG